MRLSDFARMPRRAKVIRSARGWLLAVAVLVSSIGVLAAGGASETGTGSITTKNWITHPSIKQVRAAVADIVHGMKSGKIRVEEIAYDITSGECEDHVVTIGAIIGFDVDGTVRYYKEVHFVAPEAVGSTEYFLDKTGITRFLFASFDEEGWQNSRAYFDETGKGLFSIEQIGREYLEDRTNADEYIRFTSDKIKQTYKIKVECPVKSQKILSKEDVARLFESGSQQ